MSTQYVYHFDPVSKFYTGQKSILERDPVENKPIPPAWSTLSAPPAADDNEIAVIVAKDTWALQPDYRGYVGFDLSGQQHMIMEINVEPDPLWSLDRPFIFSEAMATKKNEINMGAEQAFLAITGSYLQYEIDTFKTQEEEASAWRLDSAAATPTLDGIIANRPGVTKSILVDRILDVNAPAYKAISGVVMGKKQHFEDLLEALNVQHQDSQQPDVTQADFDAIVVDFS